MLADEVTGEIWVFKLPSTPDRPASAIFEGIRTLMASASATAADIALLAHGTTVGLNAVLERRLARTALLATDGFRDVPELARQRRPDIYNLDVDKPDPVAPRELRLGVRERMGPRGEVVTPLDHEHAMAQLESLREVGIEAIAICLLHSYANPEHERQLAALVRTLYPEIAVSLSSDVMPEFREYERFSTTLLNAAIVPKIRRYLVELGDRARALGVRGAPQVMQSNGGLLSAFAAAERPVDSLFSGPSAGVIGATRRAAESHERELITFDMGGTSTDVCLVRGGVVPISRERDVANMPVRSAMVDVHSVGAGGGSVGWIDAGGLLKVGPQSAGAVPGPACYGRGGARATVTDADVALGYLHPEALLGGRLPIDRHAAELALARLGAPLGLDGVEAARGMFEILHANLVRAVRLVSVERGFDPREFTLVAFGGAGPVHAARLARDLGIARVLVPPHPGILCALGLITADARIDLGRTVMLPAVVRNAPALERAFAELEAAARQRMAREGLGERATLERAADIRYRPQNHELTIGGVSRPLDEAGLTDLARRFHAEHSRAYGYDMPHEDLDVVTIRVTAVAARAERTARKAAPPPRVQSAGGFRRAFFDEAHGFVECVVLAREDVVPGDAVPGPAIIEQMDSTTVVPPGFIAQADDLGNLMLTSTR